MPKLRFFGCAIPNRQSARTAVLRDHTLVHHLQLGVTIFATTSFSALVSPPIKVSFGAIHLRFGEVESLFEREVAPSATQSKFIRAAEGVAKPNKSAPVDLKALLVSIHLAILTGPRRREILRSMYSGAWPC